MDIFWHSSLSTILDVTFVDTRNQFETRGLEKTISASVILNRTFQSGFSMNINYAYTNNISLDSIHYAFSKHVLGCGLAFKI